VETAAIVINAATGIEPMAVRMMEWAKQRERDRIIIVNKIDAQGVNLAGAGGQIQAPSAGMPAAEPAVAGRRAQVLDCFWKMKDDGRRRTSPPSKRRTARWWSRWWKSTPPSSSAT
jgi:elongation factor G